MELFRAAPDFVTDRDQMPLTLSPDERRRRRLQLRQVGRSLMDDSVASPCIAVCQIDDATALCVGCSRSVGEVTDWSLLTAEEKRGVLAELAERSVAQQTTGSD